MASKRLKNKIEKIFKETREPMTTRQIIQHLAENRYAHLPSHNALGNMMRDKRFTVVGSVRATNSGPVAVWYLKEDPQ